MLRGRRAVAFVVCTMLAIPLLASPGPASAAPSAVAVVAGLNYPAMFTFAPDGRVFYSELFGGRIGVFNPADGTRTTYFQVPDLCTSNDQGLYGLALHPQFPAVASVYAYATRRAADGTCANQVLRIDPGRGRGHTMSVLVSDTYVRAHVGGRMLFGPDGNLYISTGDGSDAAPSLAASQSSRASVQDVGSVKGKILRMAPDGSVPPDNPFGNLVFASGFRNVFGFDFDPVGGRLWAVDNGPDKSDYSGAPSGPGPNGGCNDELDVVGPGLNYGWGPLGSCGKPPEAPLNANQDGANVVLPAFNIESAQGVTGGRFCSGCGLGRAYAGRLFYARYGNVSGEGEIHAATLSADGAAVVSDALVYRVPGTSPLSIERGPDGTLYFSDAQGIYKLVH